LTKTNTIEIMITKKFNLLNSNCLFLFLKLKIDTKLSSIEITIGNITGRKNDKSFAPTNPNESYTKFPVTIEYVAKGKTKVRAIAIAATVR